MNDDLEAIDGLCAKIIEQRDRIEELEKALSTAQQVIYDLTEGITGTTQRDRIEALEKALRLAIEELGWGEMEQARKRLRAALAKEQDKP